MIVSSTSEGRMSVSFKAFEAIPLGTPSPTTGFEQMECPDGNLRPSWCAYFSTSRRASPRSALTCGNRSTVHHLADVRRRRLGDTRDHG
jgi:hypothetical protein